MTSLAIETHGLGKRFGARAALESIEHLGGRENLHVHAAARDRGAHARVQAALDRVGLAPRADDKAVTSRPPSAS